MQQYGKDLIRSTYLDATVKTAKLGSKSNPGR